MKVISVKLIPNNKPNDDGFWVYLEVPYGRSDKDLMLLVPYPEYHIVSLRHPKFPVERKECLSYNFEWDTNQLI